MIDRSLAAGLLVALLLCAVPAQAGTTGSLTGRVTESGTNAPVAGATVQVVSSSQTATTRTDAKGAYSFISLGPDTYTVSVELAGYDPQAQPGQTILSDQSSTLNFVLRKTLKTIATTRSVAAGSLVRAGTTSDVYSVNAATQRVSKALGGSGSLDQAYGAIASVPGVSIPSGQQGWYQSVFIRGGDYDQVAYEFDGVPVIRESDGAPIVTLSALGQQEVQVYTGGTPATSDSPGLAGYINQVIKTGTAPGYADFNGAVGGPAFYHKLSFETGAATPDRRFSYYVGLAGANEDYRYGDQYNGVSDPLYFYPLTIPTTNTAGNILDGSCGSYPLTAPCPGPNYGATFAPGNAWTQSNNNDREAVVNVHFGIPHRHDALRDDVQALYVAGSIFTQYNSSANFLGVGGPVAWLDGLSYTGQLFAPPDATKIVPVSFPSSPTDRSANSLVNPNQSDGGNNDYSVLKLQYQKNLNDRSYLRAIGYSEYTDWFLNGPNSSQNTFGATLSDYEVVGHIYGGSLIYSNDLSRQHLLTASLSYQTQKLQTYNATFDSTFGAPNTGQFGNIVADYVGNDGNCYNFSTGAPWSCYDPTTIGTPSNNLNPGDCVSAGTCTSNAPSNAVNQHARWLVTENGQDAQVDNVTPHFTSGAITDVYRPNDRFTINLGARFDHFGYKLNDLADGYPARAFWFQAYNHEHCGAPGQPNVSNWSTSTDAFGNVTGSFASCASLGLSPVNFTDTTGGTKADNVFQPRIAATYTVSPYTVLRASYGKYARPAATSYQEYNTFQQDLPTFLSQFAPLGYTSPVHDVVADTSNNADFSYEHRFPGTRFSMKISPFYRTTKNQLQYLNISALGGTLAGINVGTLKAYGTELSLQYGDFAAQGLSAQLSYTYTNTHTRYASLSNGLNLIDVLNTSIEQYNSYTSACAGAAATTKLCGSGSTLYAGNAAPAVPSTTTPGLMIPNPYYNQPAQPLMDPNAQYVPYDVIPSAFASANSYAVPDVASLIVNYRHNKLAITPSLSYNSGSYYGSPLSVPGYVPQACAALPSDTPDTPGVSCGSGGAIFIPDKYTGGFDSLGSLKEPSQLTANLQLSYDVNNRTSFTLIASNLYNKCFQRGYAWDTPTACWYSSLPSNILPPAGNFLTTPPVQLAYPYGIWFNNTQVGITSARQPFQITANLEIKL